MIKNGAASISLRALIGDSRVTTISRHRMAILLAALVALILVSPLGDYAPEWVIAATTAAFLVACLQQTRSYPRLRRPARIMVLLWLGLNLPIPGVNGVWVALSIHTLLAAFVLGVLWLVARRLMTSDRVDVELICSALGGYLLLGVFWAETYGVIKLVAPAAFATPTGTVLNRGALVYFSFTTLTTTGFGDVTAINPIVRMWVVFEAIVGTIYNATVIARLVSLYGTTTK